MVCLTSSRAATLIVSRSASSSAIVTSLSASCLALRVSRTAGSRSATCAGVYSRSIESVHRSWARTMPWLETVSNGIFAVSRSS